MSACCGCAAPAPPDPRYRRALWIALVANALMFLIEFVASVHADSSSLLADAVDFLGDAGNYAVALFVLTLAPLWRSRSALWKGWLMGAYGAGVLAWTVWRWLAHSAPEPVVMSVVSVAALLVNLGVAVLLYSHRDGDAQARSVWLCSRNDALGNLAVILAAGGVWWSGSNWPDMLVALGLAGLALHSGRAVVRAARAELAGSGSGR